MQSEMFFDRLNLCQIHLPIHISLIITVALSTGENEIGDVIAASQNDRN